MIRLFLVAVLKSAISETHFKQKGKSTHIILLSKKLIQTTEVKEKSDRRL